MKSVRKCCILFLLVIFSGILFAGITGKITGKVVEKGTDLPLPGANVLLRGTYLGAASDINGNFLILNVPPGYYDIEVSVIGYQKQVIKDVLIQIDLTMHLNYILATEVIEAGSVTVIAERPAVQKDLTSSEARVSSENIDAMPVNTIGDILQLQSGVTKDAGGGIHIRGGRSTEIAYWVDGVSITDSYDGGQAVAVEHTSIQELQVISGTFNAEYGNAMSGIVNIVTKEGSNNYDGSVILYLGDYVSGKNDLYRGIKELNPTSESNLQINLSGPVPLLSKVANFYTTARHNYTDGWLYGKSYFNMYGDTLSNPQAVPMNWQERFSTHSKLSIRPFSRLKIGLAYMTSDEVYKDFDHGLQYVPDANIERHNIGRNLSLKLTHSLSSKTFYELSFAKYFKRYSHKLFDDKEDTLYIDPHYWEHIERDNPYYWFTDYAVNTNRFYRQTDTRVAKFDLTSQVTELHLIKIGGEAKFHRLELDGYSIVDDPYESDSVFTPFIPQKDVEDKKFGEFGRDYYLHKPQEFSAYFQDKLEFQSVIINIGLRWDYFDANALIPADPKEPYIDNPRNPVLDTLSLSEREDLWWKKTSIKTQISPRFGIAYPLTDKGVLHFSFGHFFQIPNFELLYTYPGYKIPETSGRFGIGGNPDMKPQKTVMYELGMRQEIISKLIVDLTGFYRDVRDWVSTGVPIDIGGGTEYVLFENKDYSNVRGLILSLEKKYQNNYWFSLSYTFQVAEGSNSNPGDAFGAMQANREPRKYIIPLGWDQRHTLNGSIYYGIAKYGATLIGRYGSGYPYTPSILTATRQGASASIQPEENSRRKQSTCEFDLKLNRKLKIFNSEISVYVDIYNLLDTQNAINVWGTTGKADSGLEELDADESSRNYLQEKRINTVSEFFTHQEWYSAPRRVIIGVNFSF